MRIVTLTDRSIEDPSRSEGVPDSIRAWLGVLVRLLRLPEGEAADIRDELEGHLRERTRDLMVGGMDEDAAVRSAIAELGEAAEVAARFRSARTTARRRFLMNASILGVAATALVVSVVSLIQPGGGAGPRAAVFTPPAPPGEIAGARAKLEAKETPLSDVLTFLASQAGKPLIVEWKSLDGVCPGADAPVTLSLASASVPEVLKQVSAHLGLEGNNRLDFRLIDGALHIGTVTHFDRVETRLVAYDLSGVMEKGIDATELFHVVMSLVDPEGWAENGGDMARGFGIGDRLFVDAPARYHARIAWIVGEVAPKEPRVAEAAGAGPARAATLAFTLQSVEPVALRELLGLWFNTSPALQRCEVTRSMEVNSQTNQLIVGATPAQIDLIARIVAAVDRPAAPLPPPEEASKQFRLRHVKPSAARTLLERVFNVSPALRQCAVGRSMGSNDNAMTLDFTATSDQVEQVERLIGLFDARTLDEAAKTAATEPGGRRDGPATGLARLMGDQDGGPRPIRQIVFRAEDGQVVVSDSSGTVQLRSPSIELSLPGPEADWVPDRLPTVRLSHDQSVPVLRDIPILSNQFRATRAVDFKLSR